MFSENRFLASCLLTIRGLIEEIIALKKSKNVLVLWLFHILNIVHLQRLKGMKRRSKLGICQWKRYKKGYLRYQKWYIAGVRGCTLPVWDLYFVENPAPPDFPLIVALAFSRHQRIRPSARKKKPVVPRVVEARQDYHLDEMLLV